MTLKYLPHESLVNSRVNSSIPKPDTVLDIPDVRPRAGASKPRPIVGDKLQIPEVKNVITRPRLIDLLDRAEIQAGATVLCGRAGTGKTLLAAEFCEKHQDPVWYSIEPADANWESFSNYLIAAMLGKAALDDPANQHATEPVDQAGIAGFLARCMDGLQRHSRGAYRLIVLDNMHHLYDAAWFPDFFNQLILSLVPNVHVLMLCRSKPQLPLWRLRSKQMLNVIDENMLAITPSETVRLCRLRGLQGDMAAQAHSRSSGRISRLMESLQQMSAF